MTSHFGSKNTRAEHVASPSFSRNPVYFPEKQTILHPQIMPANHTMQAMTHLAKKKNFHNSHRNRMITRKSCAAGKPGKIILKTHEDDET